MNLLKTRKKIHLKRTHLSMRRVVWKQKQILLRYTLENINFFHVLFDISDWRSHVVHKIYEGSSSDIVLHWYFFVFGSMRVVFDVNIWAIFYCCYNEIEKSQMASPKHHEWMSLKIRIRIIIIFNQTVV